MGQYTILMDNSTKQLIATHKINLRQHEVLVDKLVFIVPYQYNSQIDLRDFAVVVEWLDPTNVAHVDILEKEEDVYKENYQRYYLPINSPLNRYAGDIEMKLVFTYNDPEEMKRYKLETQTIIVSISEIKDYYAVLPHESFDAINDMIDKLKAQTDMLTAAAEVYNKTKADNHIITEEGELYLTANGEKIGDPVNVATVVKPDDDDLVDGIIDITGKYEDVNL